jgi:hypothetical protein
MNPQARMKLSRQTFLGTAATSAWPQPPRQTAYPHLNNGQPATLFSPYDQFTVSAHFLCMQQKFYIMYDASGWTNKSRPHADVDRRTDREQ